MHTFLATIWIVCAFIIVWAMVGYPLFLLLIDKINQKPQIKKDYQYLPTVTVMVVAHNEEKVIWEKLKNLTSIDYPTDKYSIIVTSDYSTDKTNELVQKFIDEHKSVDIRLHMTVNHGGKTNAQNEAHKKITSELTIMSDANCYFDKSAVREIVACFSNPEIKYVCGATVFTNADDNCTAESENTYWDMDSKCRDIESRFQTITAGDGNLYACRTADYKDVSFIECHDSSFPVLFALDGYRAVFDPKAIAYEKAGETDGDEYKRKVRMNRNLFHNILPSVKILNIFKYKWFSAFYFGHRTCRYLLWIAHLLLFVISGILAYSNWFWLISFIGQICFYGIAVVGAFTKSPNKIIKLVFYYTMTVIAQWNGAFNIITGKSKPTWSKAESTR